MCQQTIDKTCTICLHFQLKWKQEGRNNNNKTKRSHTQPYSRKQVIAFWDRVTTIHKGSSMPTKMRKTNSRQIQYNVENFDKIHASSASVRN